MIDQWLEDDRSVWKKQRHTAVRIYHRLVAEYQFRGAESTIRRVVRERRPEYVPSAESIETLKEWIQNYDAKIVLTEEVRFIDQGEPGDIPEQEIIAIEDHLKCSLKIVIARY